MRGGHQMCIDSEAGKIYLYGGWEGKADLGDLWVYDIAGNQWTQLSSNTEVCCTPSPLPPPSSSALLYPPPPRPLLRPILLLLRSRQAHRRGWFLVCRCVCCACADAWTFVSGWGH